MKKHIFYLVTMVAIFAAVLVSCNKDDGDGGGGNSSIADNKLEIKLETGSSRIDEIKVMVNYDDVDGHWTSEELTKASSTNGTFTLNLPKPDSKYLTSFEDGEMIAGINVSDKKAKMTQSISIYGYKDGSYVGSLVYGKVVNKKDYLEARGHLVYIDRDVTASGTIKDSDDEDGYEWESTYTISCSYKEGWNFDFDIDESYTVDKNGKEIYRGKMTTSNPGCKWYLYDDFDDLFD